MLMLAGEDGPKLVYFIFLHLLSSRWPCSSSFPNMHLSSILLKKNALALSLLLKCRNSAAQGLIVHVNLGHKVHSDV